MITLTLSAKACAYIQLNRTETQLTDLNDTNLKTSLHHVTETSRLDLENRRMSTVNGIASVQISPRREDVEQRESSVRRWSAAVRM